MTQLLSRHAEIKPDSLVSLADHLTDPQDRETYAALISYFHSLPPGDELFRLAQLLGFLSLLGQRLPDALSAFLQELREQTKAAGEYHARLDKRLASLPMEIAEGVDPAALARAMSESFRQQLAASGLQDTAALLKGSVGEVQALSGQLTAALKPLTQQYKGIGATISADLATLATASRELREHNAGLIAQNLKDSWLWKSLLGVVLFLIGGLCGIWLEKGQTLEVISNMAAQIRRIETAQFPVSLKASSGAKPRRK